MMYIKLKNNIFFIINVLFCICLLFLIIFKSLSFATLVMQNNSFNNNAFNAPVSGSSYTSEYNNMRLATTRASQYNNQAQRIYEPIANNNAARYQNTNIRNNQNGANNKENLREAYRKLSPNKNNMVNNNDSFEGVSRNNQAPGEGAQVNYQEQQSDNFNENVAPNSFQQDNQSDVNNINPAGGSNINESNNISPAEQALDQELAAPGPSLDMNALDNGLNQNGNGNDPDPQDASADADSQSQSSAVDAQSASSAGVSFDSVLDGVSKYGGPALIGLQLKHELFGSKEKEGAHAGGNQGRTEGRQQGNEEGMERADARGARRSNMRQKKSTNDNEQVNNEGQVNGQENNDFNQSNDNIWQQQTENFKKDSEMQFNNNAATPQELDVQPLEVKPVNIKPVNVNNGVNNLRSGESEIVRPGEGNIGEKIDPSKIESTDRFNTQAESISSDAARTAEEAGEIGDDMEFGEDIGEAFV